MNPKQMICDLLTRLRDAFPAELMVHHRLVYRGPADFLLTHGDWYQPRPLPRGHWRGHPKCCYSNSMIVAVAHGLAYVEGYAVHAVSNAPIHHAWNVDDAGNVVDTTWVWGRMGTCPGLAYFGVKFSPERADDCTWNGDGTVLDDPHRGYPLLRETWHGEAPDLVWPPSERLELIRGRSQPGGLERGRQWIERTRKEIADGQAKSPGRCGNVE